MCTAGISKGNWLWQKYSVIVSVLQVRIPKFEFYLSIYKLCDQVINSDS